MKQLLRTVWLKALSLVLCCGLTGLAVSTGLWSAMLMEDSQISLHSIYGAPEELWDLQETEEYVWDALRLYTLSLYEDQLTDNGQVTYQALKERLSVNRTNFRYELQNQQGKVLANNLHQQTLAEVSTHTEISRKMLVENGYFNEANIYPQVSEFEAEDQELAATWTETSTAEGYYLEETLAKDKNGNPILVPVKDAEQVVTVNWGIDKNLSAKDVFYQYATEGATVRKRLQWLLPVTALCVLLGLLAGLWFLWSCGHKRGQEGIYLCQLHRVPYDLLLVVEAAAFALVLQGFWVGRVLLPQDAEGRTMVLPVLVYVGCASGVLMLLASPVASALVTQIKARALWRRSLVGRCCGFLGRQLVRLLRGMHLFWKASIGMCGFLGAYGMLCLLSIPTSGLTLLLALVLALGALAGLIWWLKGWRRVQEATEHIAGGDLNYHIDAEKLPSDLAHQAQRLNEISVGMEKAVAQKMKSDRFRTELITNVSHDLKTPLTSIISYVDLLKKLNLKEQPIADYIDVLDRKSQRLKALTEDLVEASKAATGVLAVSLERLEVVQLVQQSLGEYEERLEKVPLHLCAQLLEKQTWIRADGRHLWRVLDNLLGNCVKYALPGTRVYLDMEDTGERVVITLKNISADPLNVPPEELLERFVRGDSSRTTEGSGLGLSIAQSLCELQGGTFALETDGDLFKVTLSFPKAN